MAAAGSRARGSWSMRRIPLLIACALTMLAMALAPDLAQAQSVNIDLGAAGQAGAT